MPFVKGESGNPSGRPVGAINQAHKTVKQTVLEVFQILQQDEKHSLEAFARKYPREYYNIAAKLIPTEVKSEVTVPEGIKIIFLNDAESLPIGTNPEDHISIQGE